MRHVTLPTGRSTSALGFGCSQLATFSPIDAPETLLQSAFDTGITHFDVARSYGRGQCEAALGKFLKGRIDQATVATKFGIGAQSAAAAAIAKALRIALKPFGSGTANRVAQRMQKRHAFSPADLAASLDASLGALGLERVDLLLLHECRLEDCTDGLLDALNSLVREGKIGAFGPATSHENTHKVLSARADFAQVAQFGNSLAARAVDLLEMRKGAFTLTHSPLRGLSELRAKSVSDPGELRALQSDEGALSAGTMLRYALSRNANGVVLFSTRSAERLRDNAAYADRPLLDESQLATLERLFA